MNEPSEHHEGQSRGPSAVVMQRVIAAIALGVAFLVLGSVFVPADSSATDEFHSPEHNGPIHHTPPAHPALPDAIDSNAADETPAEAWGDVTLTSADPHAGLPVLGSLESAEYRVVIYRTDAGPRYSVYTTDDSEPLATLMSRQMLARHFPDLPLPDVAAGESSQLMYADPDAARPH